MATRTTVGNKKESGFYKVLNGEVDMIEEEYQSNEISLTSEGVYEVERLIEKRKIKGIDYFLVLWKGYSKEASWVPYWDITELAIQLFHEPQPVKRTILDAVSAFSVAIHSSLRAGLLAKRAVTLEFPRDVFKYLFQDKGTLVKGKPGKLYERGDFLLEFFNELHFSCYNKDGDGCFVTFPIYMYSHVKFCLQSYASDGRKLNRSFTETLFF